MRYLYLIAIFAVLCSGCGVVTGVGNDVGYNNVYNQSSGYAIDGNTEVRDCYFQVYDYEKGKPSVMRSVCHE